MATRARRGQRQISSLNGVKATDSTEGTDFGALADGAEALKTFSVVQAKIGDVVAVGYDTATAHILYDGYVSAASTVKIRATNAGTGSNTPSTATKFYLEVLRPQ